MFEIYPSTKVHEYVELFFALPRVNAPEYVAFLVHIMPLGLIDRGVWAVLGDSFLTS